MDIHEIVAKYRSGEPLTNVPLADVIDALCNAIDDFIDLLEQEAQMGAFDTVPPIAIPNPDNAEEAAAFRKQWKWDAHEQVLIKGAYTGVEQENVDNASAVLSREGKKQKMEVRVGTARNRLLQEMIVDWTLTQNGSKVPVTPQSIARLPANYRTPILEQIDEIARTMDQSEQEDFLPSANGHSLGNLDEMTSSLSPS